MRPSNPPRAIEAIGQSSDRKWLTQFRTNMVREGAADIVAAIDKRCRELDDAALSISIGTPPTGLGLEQRVDEALRVHERLLQAKHGRRQAAGYSRRMLRELGPVAAVAKTVMKSRASAGFDLLRSADRLDCSYERIVLDFPDRFEPAVVCKAQDNLRNYEALA